MNNFGSASQPYPVAPATTFGGRSALRWAAVALGILTALLVGLLTLLLIGIGTGPLPFIIGLLLATLPVPVYVSLVLWIDRYESEPLWSLATSFFWGALVAVFIAFVLNTAGSIIVGIATMSDGAAEFSGAVVFAPTVEESAKALVLFGLFFWKRDEFDGVLDGIVYASMVGLGFAMTENVQYYGGAALEGGAAESIRLFMLRGLIAPFSHPLFTSMTGIGLGLASQTKNNFLKFFAPVLGLGLAMLLHCLWNLSATISGVLFILAYIFIMVPVLVAVLVAVFFALRREGRIVREHLYTDFQQGVFTPQEYERLCSIRGRMGASWGALTSGGLNRWRSRMRYNSTASELAFHRSRVARGLAANDSAAAAREETYRRTLHELRGQLGSH
ncbi:MAG: PrsW family intramembrane metalloprotease [Pyrinomonadaceae bacterium]|nr:PrsW family intramembrane metalloprotease [Pyrinomonadaceae bacterium]